MPPRLAKIATRLCGLMVRVASILGGVLILKHEVYDTAEAQLFVIALGLWLIGIPPALWLEALRKTTSALEPDRNGTRSRKDDDAGVR